MLRFLLSLIMFSFCLKDQNDETNRTQKHTNCIFEVHRKSTAAKQRKTSKDTKKQPPIFSYGRLLSLVYHN